jgi:rhamnosyltransferase
MVAAVIVLYNPEMTLLDRLLRSVVGQVKKIFVIDNTTGASEGMSSYFNKYQGCISYLPLGDNKGIATAQNMGIRKSVEGGFSHVLLLDQDSVLPPDMVKKLLNAEQELLREGKKVAAVGPLFVDEKTGRFPRAIRHKMQALQNAGEQKARNTVETDWIMASGSMIRSSVFSEVGPMLDELFIDIVDTEWGLRSKNNGYSCYLIPDVLLQHSTGDRVIQVLGREIFLHNNTRNCYIVRNSTYLLRRRYMGWRWRASMICKIPSYILVYCWYSDHRFESLVLLSKALLNGARGKLGRLD